MPSGIPFFFINPSKISAKLFTFTIKFGILKCNMR